MQDFITARKENLNVLAGLEEGVWAKPARHAIFGPTDFKEVIGFIADHDRMHIQQAQAILQVLKAA